MAFKKKDAEIALINGYAEAEETLNDSDKLEEFLLKLEKKLKTVPMVGESLSHVPAMASLLRSYAKKEYTSIPIKSIIAITSAMIYLVSPVDLIPDSIPVIGYVDDAAVIRFCWGLVEADVEEYNAWRVSTGRVTED